MFCDHSISHEPLLCYNDDKKKVYCSIGDHVMVAVGVIGSGAWGTTLACLLANKGIETTLWEHRPERATEMQRQCENVMFLPGIRFPAMLHVTSEVAEAAWEKDMLLLVTPSQRMRENVRLLAPYVG